MSAGAGPLLASDFSVFRRAKSCLSRLRYGLLWLRFVGFGFSKTRLGHWSSKGVLGKKRGQVNGKKAELLQWYYLYWYLHLAYTTTVLIRCRSISNPCTNFACAVTSCFPPGLIVSGPITWPTVVNCTPSPLAFLCFWDLHWLYWKMCERRLAGKQSWHTEDTAAASVSELPSSVWHNRWWGCPQTLGHEQESENLSGGSARCTERCSWSRGSSLLPLDEAY